MTDRSTASPGQPVPVRLSRGPRHKRPAGDLLVGTGALVVLALLVVGVPFALATLIGWPLPHHVPNLDMLRQPIDSATLQHVLAVLVWLAWAQFSACVIVEAKAEITGVGLPARVPGFWGSQLAARQLVAAALLLMTSATGFAPGLSSLGPSHSATAPQQTVQRPPAHPSSSPATTAAATPDRPAPRVTKAHPHIFVERPALPDRKAAASKVKKIYVVRPPHGRHHESLWEIAERHLGDGRRYREIFELNKARVQPDGDRLHIARLIRPGWVLEMPADAVGVETVREDAPASHPSGSGSEASASDTGTPPVNKSSAGALAPATESKAGSAARSAGSASPAESTSGRQDSPQSSQQDGQQDGQQSSQQSSQQDGRHSREVAVPPAAAKAPALPVGSPAPTGPPTVPPTQPSTRPAGQQPALTADQPAATADRHAGRQAAGQAAAGQQAAGQPAATPGRHAAGVPATAPPATGAASTKAHDDGVAAAAHPRGQAPDAETPAVAQPPDSTGSRLPAELAGATLLAAGLLAALSRHRRQQLWRRAFGRSVHAPQGEAAVAEEAIRLGADPAAARFLDLGLRELSRARAAAGQSLPTAYAARIHADGVDLLLSPPDRDAPGPWVALEAGMVWRLPASAVLDEAVLRDVLAPYPGLVSLGTDEHGRVMVDLEAASGIVAVRGPADHVQAVLAAVGAELATNRWSDHMRVTLVGFGDELPLLAPERVRSVATLTEVLPELEAHAAETRQALAASGVDSVLTGRCQGLSGDAWTPHFVIVAREPAAAEAVRLARLAASSQRTATGYLVAGDVPGTAAVWEVSEAGRLRVGLLGVEVDAQRLPQVQYAAVVELFRAATDLEGDVLPEVADLAAKVAELQHPAPVNVHLLGPVHVQSSSVLEDGRAETCTELLVYLATHRDGVHPTVLGGAVWPRGVSASVRDATIARVREWLGTDETGAPLLFTADDGRLRVAPGVRTDWDVFTVLQQLAAIEPENEITYLEQALGLIRAPLLAGRPPGRYAWLASEQLEYVVPAWIADTASRLAELQMAAGEVEQAIAAIRAGLRGAPHDEELWRSLLRATHATGDGARLRSVVAELSERAARDESVDRLHPLTEALIEELMPAWRLSLAN